MESRPMSGQTLCWRLYGAMAAWGSPAAAGGERPSDTRPGRGAVVGILSAALGLRHDDQAAIADLAAGIWVATASHGRLRLASDFRTAQPNPQPGRNQPPWITRRDALIGHAAASKRSNPQIGMRQHVEDSLWRVFVAVRPSSAVTLEGLRRALASPAFHICLGRRECPLGLPMSPELVDGGLEQAIAVYPAVPRVARSESAVVASILVDLERRLSRHDRHGYRLHWDVGFPGAPPGGQARPVGDDPASRRDWRFLPRIEAWTMIRPRPQDPAVAAPDEVTPEDIAIDRAASDPATLAFFDSAGEG